MWYIGHGWLSIPAEVSNVDGERGALDNAGIIIRPAAMPADPIDAGAIKGRGARLRPDVRYLEVGREAFDDGWQREDEALPKLQTTVTIEHAKTIISHNQSPDVPFEQSINPYRGCEHGCSYCYARPAHAYMDLSPGLDFETRLFAKPQAAELLRQELAARNYACKPIALGTNTDAYQPIERDLRITRAILEVLAETRHPVTIVSKAALVERDLDLLAPMAADRLVQVFISVTTLDRELARRMEPRAAAPQRRLETLRRLAAAGVPAGVMFAPVIPGLNDDALEAVLAAAGETGCRHAGYVMLRLPREVNPLFQDWLAVHYPLKAKRVMNRIRDLRDGRENDPAFGSRMTGTGIYARLIAARFARACKEQGLNRSRDDLETGLFRPPRGVGGQLELF